MVVTMHELAILKIVANHPDGEVKRGGLNKFIKELGTKFEFDFSDCRCHCIPDAWSYSSYKDEHHPGTLNLFEIEDRHKLTVEKLRYYSDLWFVYDSVNLGLRLFVYDRYGENVRELDLFKYCYMFDRLDIKEKNSLKA